MRDERTTIRKRVNVRKFLKNEKEKRFPRAERAIRRRIIGCFRGMRVRKGEKLE